MLEPANLDDSKSLAQMAQAVIDGLSVVVGGSAAFMSTARRYPVRPPLPSARPCAAATRIVRWDDWPGPKAGISIALGGALPLPGLVPVTQRDVHPEWSCDIRDVEAVSASRWPLERFTSLDDCAIACCSDLISDVSEERLQELMSHEEMRRLLQPPRGYHFFRYSWDGRICLANQVRVEHFIAARYIAGQLDKRVPIRGRLEDVWLDARAITETRRRRAIFSVSAELVLSGGLCELLRQYGAEFRRMDFPWNSLRPCGAPRPETELVVLDRRNAMSRRVESWFIAAGFCDVLAELQELARIAERTCKCGRPISADRARLPQW